MFQARVRVSTLVMVLLALFCVAGTLLDAHSVLCESAISATK